MKKSKILALVMLVVMSFSLVACGKSSQSVVGTWAGSKEEVEYKYVFNEDGTGTMTKGDMSLAMDYKVEGDKIQITVTVLGKPDTSEFTYSIKDKVLTMSGSDMDMELNRQ